MFAYFEMDAFYYVGLDVLQVLVIRAEMKQDDDLARIVDTTISTFGQLDILVR